MGRCPVTSSPVTSAQLKKKGLCLTEDSDLVEIAKGLALRVTETFFCLNTSHWGLLTPPPHDYIQRKVQLGWPGLSKKKIKGSSHFELEASKTVIKVCNTKGY